jgi:hypothetical protein
VIELVNRETVPVWINVRTTPVPRFPFVSEILINGRLDSRNFIADPFSEGFFVRSLVITPDGQTLLNPQPPTVAGASLQFFRRGDVSYAQMDAGDFLAMLQRALSRYFARE